MEFYFMLAFTVALLCTGIAVGVAIARWSALNSPSRKIMDGWLRAKSEECEKCGGRGEVTAMNRDLGSAPFPCSACGGSGKLKKRRS